MKRITEVWIVLAICLSATAAPAAEFALGLKLPVQKAKLIETDADGHELNTDLNKVLYEQRKSRDGYAAEFSFSEEHRKFCVTAPCAPIVSTDSFVVVSKRVDDCGDIRYVAVNRKNLNLTFADGFAVNGLPKQTLELVDHGKNHCDIYNKYAWEARLQTPVGTASQVRQLSGNPKPVNAFQSGCNRGEE